MTGKTDEIEYNGKKFTAPPIPSIFPCLRKKKKSKSEVSNKAKPKESGTTLNQSNYDIKQNTLPSIDLSKISNPEFESRETKIESVMMNPKSRNLSLVNQCIM